METIEIPFDDQANYEFEAGIEVVNSCMRLIDPNEATPQAAYWTIELSEKNIAALTVEHTFVAESQGIPMSIWSEEPSFGQILDNSGELFLADLWAELAKRGEGKWYIGVVMGGVLHRPEEFPPFDPNAYWNFNGNANESRGNGINGILVGNTVQTPGMWDTLAYYFDGNGDSINMGTYLGHRVTGNQTICMWVYPYAVDTQRRNPWDKNYGGEGTITMELDGRLNYYYGTNGGNAAPYQAFLTTSALVPNTWQHIAIVRDLTNMKLHWYINGMLDNTTDALYAQAAISTSALTIGDGYVYSWHGKIDEVLLYSKALDLSQIQLVSRGGTSGDVEYPRGQATIEHISIVMESEGFEAGNVIAEKVYSYLGNSEQDTLIHLDSMAEASSTYSNILITQDRVQLDYIIINEGSGKADVIVKTLATQENLIISINDSFNSSWSCAKLVGNGMDFRVNKGISGSGAIRLLTDSWEMDKGGRFTTELDPETDLSALYLVAVLRKDSTSTTDTVLFEITIGSTVLEILIDDAANTMTIGNDTFNKPGLPWVTNYINFTVRLTENMTLLMIDGEMVYRTGSVPDRSQASIEMKRGECKGQMKSFYYGPLSVGESEHEDLDNLEKKLIVAGPTTCTGNMFLAGNQILDSVAQLYMVSTYIYQDGSIYCRTPGFFLKDPVLLGIRDTVTGTEVLYYGSNTEYGVYIYKEGYWSLFEPDILLFSIWRSRHTEGLVIQRKDEYSIKIYLFKRDKDTRELIYNKDIAMTGLPEGENQKYKFEPSMDRRISQKTTPWIWAEDKSLSS